MNYELPLWSTGVVTKQIWHNFGKTCYLIEKIKEQSFILWKLAIMIFLHVFAIPSSSRHENSNSKTEPKRSYYILVKVNIYLRKNNLSVNFKGLSKIHMVKSCSLKHRRIILKTKIMTMLKNVTKFVRKYSSIALTFEKLWM